MKRFPFLDWMRGLAVVIMIQCHVFNSFTRLDLRDGGPYILSQFVGGMAAPLFLFMAGMTLAFQMESLYRREPDPRRRWWAAMRRAGYILAIAFAFRLTNWMGSYPNGSAQEIFKVDILNCMGVAMAAFSVAAMVRPAARAQFAVGLALAIAAASPLMTNISWTGAPDLLHQYLVPVTGRGQFAFFPCAAYVGFGLALGTVVKRTAEERFDRLVQWTVLLAFGMIFAAQYFANIPFSVYPKSNFWTDSPSLILIRVGVAMLMLAAAYLWTQYGAQASWSWMQTLGKTSLMVYWVHVVMVYGALGRPLKRTMNIPQAALATLIVIGMMVALSAGKLWWKARRAQTPIGAATVRERSSVLT